MTKQQLFNRVWRGLKKQGFKQCKKPSGTCMYRRGNMKCAAGHLIQDKHYNTYMEGRVVAADNAPAKALLKSGVRKHQLQLVCDLQQAHDYQVTPARMKESLIEVAKSHRLEIPSR